MLNPFTAIQFENIEDAFAYKTDRQLKKAYRLFSLLQWSVPIRIGIAVTPLLLKPGWPFRQLMRATLFEQFVGGETLEETKSVTNRLEAFHVQVILDYGAEHSGRTEAEKDRSTAMFLKVIAFAAIQPNIPFISIKLTALARFSLLEKMDRLMCGADASLLNRYDAMLLLLTSDEVLEWEQVVKRLDQIVEAASKANRAVLIDAEESWIQQPADALVLLLMCRYNRERPVVYNTVQLYRHDRIQFLHQCFEEAVKNNFIYGVKLVRGAYMEKERERAMKMQYPSPIHACKEDCDRDFDASVVYCIERLKQMAVVIATHNEISNAKAAQWVDDAGIDRKHPHIHFSQLFGMSDHITFALSKAGYMVSKYVPFGPLEEVLPYLIRRARENTSIAGQAGRELRLLKSEMKRRRLI